MLHSFWGATLGGGRLGSMAENKPSKAASFPLLHFSLLSPFTLCLSYQLSLLPFLACSTALPSMEFALFVHLLSHGLS